MTPIPIPLETAFDIQNLIARFANSFDLKHWQQLGHCLADQVYTDYSQLRGTPPQTLSRAEFVSLRKVALDDLRTHHLAGNLEFTAYSDTQISLNVSMQIYRKNHEGQVFDTHCLYQLDVSKTEKGWQICRIVQKVFWSDGQAQIHAGVIARQ